MTYETFIGVNLSQRPFTLGIIDTQIGNKIYCNYL